MVLITICALLFAGQSWKEIQKFFLNLRSTGISVQVDPGIEYPIIVVCHEHPFKTNGI